MNKKYNFDFYWFSVVVGAVVTHSLLATVTLSSNISNNSIAEIPAGFLPAKNSGDDGNLFLYVQKGGLDFQHSEQRI